MGLIDKLFGKKRDYAQEFKDAFLNGQPGKCATIVSDWHKHTTHDANQDYADAILGSVLAYQDKNKEFLEKAEYIFDNTNPNCENPSLTEWFKTAAKVSIMKARTEM